MQVLNDPQIVEKRITVVQFVFNKDRFYVFPSVWLSFYTFIKIYFGQQEKDLCV
jgi:hypothetical protein